MKQMHLLCLLIITAAIALGNFSEAFPISGNIDLKSENVYIDGNSADKLYLELVLMGAPEKLYPELPIPPNLQYGKVKEIHWKNINCIVSQYNPNFNGISAIEYEFTKTNCIIKLKE